MYTDLKNVIEFILTYYENTNTLWVSQRELKYFINLKKQTVASILENDRINEYILDYIKTIYKIPIGVGEINSVLKKSSMRNRIKTQNSVAVKIRRYCDEEHSYGKIPINKCLNDLLGFRIIINDDFAYDDIKSYIYKNYPSLKCLDSSKNGYIATHIYFSKSGDNRLFPWELQIWRKADEKNNVFQHYSYKEEYTKWETEIKED